MAQPFKHIRPETFTREHRVAKLKTLAHVFVANRKTHLDNQLFDPQDSEVFKQTYIHVSGSSSTSS